MDEGIAFHEGKPVFIENAIPDEVIEFDIKSDEGTYLVGELTRLVEQSSKRRYPTLSNLERVWWMCFDARKVSSTMQDERG